jgi:hypothetical protein
MPYEPNVCVECGADMRPSVVPPDAISWSGAKALDEGAAEIREEVEEMKRRTR